MSSFKPLSGGEQVKTRRRAKLQALGVSQAVLAAYDSAQDDNTGARQIIAWCRTLRKAQNSPVAKER